MLILVSKYDKSIHLKKNQLHLIVIIFKHAIESNDSIDYN